MNKKVLISSVIIIIVILVGFYLYLESRAKSESLLNEQVTPITNTQTESEKETLGYITFIDNSYFKLKEVLRDTNCFDSMDIDVDDDPEIKEKSLQSMQGTITQEEFNRFFIDKVNKKYNNNLPWCPKGALYNETGKEITFNINADTVFTTFSFDEPTPVWDKLISREEVIKIYNTSDGFHSRVEITSKGLNAIKVHYLYQE